MRYEQIRQHVQAHFQEALRRFQENVAADGPFTGSKLDALRSSQELAGADPEDWAELLNVDGPNGFLRRFRDAQGIPDKLSASEKTLLLEEFQKGYLAFVSNAQDHNANFDGYDLRPTSGPPAPAPAYVPVTETIDDVINSYLAEGGRVGAWTSKTLDEKRDALALLSEVTDVLPPAAFTKADARSVKELLLKLPKNRRKMPATRHLSARDAIKVEGVGTIAPTTVNGYLSNFQSFFRWAVNNGYATDNPFTGVGVVVSARKSGADRKAFTARQLSTIESALLSDDRARAPKPHHRWAVLVAIYSGARLNEVAQMHKSDVRLVDGIWCFDINETMDKKLKTPAAARVIPIHARLDLSRFRAAPSARLSYFPFESDGAFPAQC